MFAYYLGLGFHELRAKKTLTILVVITLAIGVASNIVALTVLYSMSGDPIPEKSDRLFVPLLDPRPLANQKQSPEPPGLISYRDAMALLKAGHAMRQTPLYGITVAVEPVRSGQRRFWASGVAVAADFFPMFDVPFVHGGFWRAEDDARSARVVVLREVLANRIFGSEDPTGREFWIGRQSYTVVGVIADDYKPKPKFYRLVGSPSFSQYEDVFIPFNTTVAEEMGISGTTSCWGDTGPGFQGVKDSASCAWIQFWIELDSANDAPRYEEFLASYVEAQRSFGRFEGSQNHHLHDLRTWLDIRAVVSSDSRLHTWIALGFLLVCLINATSLMFAKFAARSNDIAVRRALGASRLDVFGQYLTAAAIVGLGGGGLGVGLSWMLLDVLSGRSAELETLAHLDVTMFVTAFILALAASLLAGVFPAIRACLVHPSNLLKS